MEVPAFRIKQWGYGEGAQEQVMYVTSIPAKQLGLAEIDRWTKVNREGYQRSPEESRLKPKKGSVVRYLLEEMGAFPTSILLNVRGSLKFKEESVVSKNISFGKLIIPENEKLWIIDGQHRIEALKRAISEKPELEDYPVPVSISNLKEKFEEMLLFYIVNSRQKKIKTELAYRQLQSMSEMVKIKEKYKWIKDTILGRVQERQATAALIVDCLADREDSPFANRIWYIGDDPTDRRTMIEDSILIRYISKLMGELTFSSMPPERIADLLIEYWSAIADLYPKCFSEDTKDNYTLLKHTGIASFTYLFPVIYGLCAEKGELTKDAMKIYLGYLKEDLTKDVIQGLDPDFKRPVDEEWWSSEHGSSLARATSEGTFNLIKNQMAMKIHFILKKRGESSA